MTFPINRSNAMAFLGKVASAHEKFFKLDPDGDGVVNKKDALIKALKIQGEIGGGGYVWLLIEILRGGDVLTPLLAGVIPSFIGTMNMLREWAQYGHTNLAKANREQKRQLRELRHLLEEQTKVHGGEVKALKEKLDEATKKGTEEVEKLNKALSQANGKLQDVEQALELFKSIDARLKVLEKSGEKAIDSVVTGVEKIQELVQKNQEDGFSSAS